MIRQKHPHTKVQRAETPEAVTEAVRKRGFEPSDVPAGRVGVALILLYVLLGVSGAAVAGLLLLLKGQEPGRLPPAFTPAAPPPPRLEINPLANRLAHEAPAKARLEEHGSPQDQGAAPVPIEDAMRAVAAEGWLDAAPPLGQAGTAKAHAEKAR